MINPSRLARLNAEGFGYFLLLMCFINVMSITLGLLISVLTPTVEGGIGIAAYV